MRPYLDALRQVYTCGIDAPDRTGTGTKSCFGLQSRYDLTAGFPAVTTKKLAWKAVVSELLWFIEGSTDERRLCEILHGTRDPAKTTIWTANAQADYWAPHAAFPGDLGRVYSAQWRDWKRPDGTSVDQLVQLIEGIKQDPYSRRHILISYNPGEINDMALPPCHSLVQFYVRDGKLSCQMYQRSADMPLGVPFNVASYSLMTHMIAQVCGLGVGEFVHVIGDAHVYHNQLDGVAEQLSRIPLPLPKLMLNSDITDITRFTMKDIWLDGYTHHDQISYSFST